MREIEIKAKIDDTNRVIALLRSKGHAVSDLVEQHDRVYGLPGVGGTAHNQEPWLRIRTETKYGETKHIFTLKKSVTNQLDSIEHETEVTDPEELEKIILHMNFEPYSDLTKKRQKAHLGDIEICIDEIDGLGSYIEAEKITPDEINYEAVVNELWTVLESFGISRSDEVTDGYDVLMNRKIGKEK